MRVRQSASVAAMAVALAASPEAATFDPLRERVINEGIIPCAMKLCSRPGHRYERFCAPGTLRIALDMSPRIKRRIDAIAMRLRPLSPSERGGFLAEWQRRCRLLD